MTVYVLIDGFLFEGCEIINIFMHERDAEDALERAKKSGLYSNPRITEWEVEE